MERQLSNCEQTIEQTEKELAALDASNNNRDDSTAKANHSHTKMVRRKILYCTCTRAF